MKKYLLTVIFASCQFALWAQTQKPTLEIKHLVDSFYTYVSYGSFNEKNYPANAMYLVTRKGVILFDTPWDSSYYQPLLDSISARHHKKVLMCISTHFHTDRTGGLAYYAGKGIKTYTTRITDSLSKIHDKKRANYLVSNDTAFNIDGQRFATFYPGPGHSQDNIVIWFPRQKILYGGCFIKSVVEKDLGNTQDSDVKKWAQSIQKVQQKFPNPHYIIVGHNDFSNTHSISHTLKLIREYNATHK